MSDGLLTQEEIDALLRAQVSTSSKTPSLSPEEIDALREIGNIVMGSASTVLSMLVGRSVDISVKDVREGTVGDVYGMKSGSNLLLRINFTEGLSGESAVILSEQGALLIADFMMGGDGSSLPEELNELYQSAVNEALSQMMGSMTTTLSTLLGGKYVILPPTSERVVLDNRPPIIGGLSDDSGVVYIIYNISIGESFKDDMIHILPLEMAKTMVSKLIASSEAKEAAPAQEVKRAPRVEVKPTAAPSGPKGVPKAPPVEAKPVQFAPLQATQAPSVPPKNINLILDIPLRVTVELGKTEMLIRDILNLGPGSIIELDKLAGEPVEVLVNGKPIARGEVVVIDENFGVRITDIISPRERLEKLT